MIKKFLCWLALIAIAFAIDYADLAHTAKAFCWMHAGFPALSLTVLLLVCAIGKEVTLKQHSHTVVWFLHYLLIVALIAGVSYVASLFLEVDFYKAYMLVSAPLPFAPSLRKREVTEPDNTDETDDDVEEE